MRGYAGYLFLEESNARVELIQRIAIEAFPGELAGGSEGVAQLRSIFVGHCSATSVALGLLSTGLRSSAHSHIFAAVGGLCRLFCLTS